jgi:peptidoglycan-associated lipoprotein
MVRPRLLEVIGMVAVLVVAAGCAKRPVGLESKVAGTSAPAPTVAPPAVEPPASRPDAGASVPPSGAAPAPRPDPPAPTTPPSGSQRPSPGDFSQSSALKDAYFDFDRYNIRPDAAATLMANAAWLKQHPGSSVLIEGHCDERGTTEYNLALGQRRAQATRDFLVAQGVAGTRLTAISYGKERPVCPESTESCWARNRRAHVLVRPS